MLIEEINEKDKEIERLNKAREIDIEYNKYLQKEIIRLNNIINELEKWLEEEHKKKQKWYNEQLSTNDKRYYEEKYLTSLTMINVFFDKLQELKGSDKEGVG